MAPNCSDQKLFFGRDDGGLHLREELCKEEYARILFVTGRESFLQSGAERFLYDATGMDFEFRFSEFNPNPSYDDVLRGLKYFDAVKPDCIVAVGGGSVLDMAKLINFFGYTRLSLSDYLQRIPAKEEAVLLPLIAIPTTAGAGSESTGFAVLYKDQKKVSVEDPRMVPNVVILNPELTLSMSAYQSACCGFDAFSQALESYWAVGATDVSRHYSAKAITLCMNHLEEAVLDPTIEHRTGMMEAAYLAGKAINIAKTTAAHALSYTLTAHYGLSHGHAVAMMLPWVFELNAAVQELDLNDPRGMGFVGTRMDELCAMLDCGSADDAVRFLRRLALRIGLDGAWVSNLDVEEVRSCIVDHANMERMGNNPRVLSIAHLHGIAAHIC